MEYSDSINGVFGGPNPLQGHAIAAETSVNSCRATCRQRTRLSNVAVVRALCCFDLKSSSPVALAGGCRV